MSNHFGYNYHTHTFRCGHALGDEVDMARVAYENGYRVLGISDHVFIPGVPQPTVRGDYSYYNEYISNLKTLKEQYKGKMEVYSAFECEYLGEPFIEYYLRTIVSGDVDYLLLGQHCRMNADATEFELYRYRKDRDNAVRLYTDDLIKGMETGLFIYVCHPDVFLRYIDGWNEVCEECSRRIIDKAIELDLPLEINAVPSRFEHRVDENGNRVFSYPSNEFWTIAKEKGAKCIVGVDAHDPDHLINTEFDELRKFIKRHELNPIDRLDIEEYRKKLFDRYHVIKKSN